ncbi:hypothetical protein CIB48_g1331 [Xylaria polymorpha]|nr:hypothetical protein CIB48_g1331 [Xylaria polymorpha]
MRALGRCGTVVTVTTAHRRHFSAGGWHNAKQAKAPPKRGKVPPKPKPTIPSRFKWASRGVPESEDLYGVLESYILDSSVARLKLSPSCRESSIPTSRKASPIRLIRTTLNTKRRLTP